MVVHTSAMARTKSGNTEISWERTGSGEPVVLVHGITENGTAWSPIVDRLSASNDVIVVDLRGHGDSSSTESYDLADMAGDIQAVVDDAGVERPHLVGHSLGGAVVTALGSTGAARTVANIDQSLQLSAFKDQVSSVEAMLRNPDSFSAVIAGLFDELMGPRLPVPERDRLTALRRPDQEVVLGVWRLLFESTAAEVDATIDATLAGYRAAPTPYLTVLGAAPNDGYQRWLGERIPDAVIELWPDHGHYPHLVDPDGMADRLRSFWVSAA